ncbi:MAG: hypothetical protein OEV91_06535 [Desulfobulbaceae bacterium]|nr:hypothetical protein [Desulfobulbaceae bacterium]
MNRASFEAGAIPADKIGGTAKRKIAMLKNDEVAKTRCRDRSTTQEQQVTAQPQMDSRFFGVSLRSLACEAIKNDEVAKTRCRNRSTTQEQQVTAQPQMDSRFFGVSLRSLACEAIKNRR